MPTRIDYKIQDGVRDSNIQTVADLIDQTTSKWNSELIFNTFNPIDAACILSIPLSVAPIDDFLAWR